MLTNVDEYLWCEPVDFLIKKGKSKGKEIKAEMSRFESAFLCGLLRQKKPQKILEVGVAAGGTTALILCALEMLELDDTTLHSVDLDSRYYRDKTYEVGYMTNTLVPHLMDKRTLYSGRAVGAFIEKIGNDIDFCIIDTVHYLPGEVIDFLSIFPSLTKGATVVLHDTHMHLFGSNGSAIATKVVLDSVVADKIRPQDSSRKDTEELPNISAFVINDDTKKYISDVFSTLSMPWAYMPSNEILKDSLDAIERSYDSDKVDYFKRSIMVNKVLLEESDISIRLAMLKLAKAICYSLPYGLRLWQFLKRMAGR